MRRTSWWIAYAGRNSAESGVDTNFTDTILSSLGWTEHRVESADDIPREGNVIVWMFVQTHLAACIDGVIHDNQPSVMWLNVNPLGQEEIIPGKIINRGYSYWMKECPN